VFFPQVVFWASGSKSVLARQQRRLGALVLSEKAVPISDDQALGALMQVGVQRGMFETPLYESLVLVLRCHVHPPGRTLTDWL
jgi:hypothetical protein